MNNNQWGNNSTNWGSSDNGFQQNSTSPAFYSKRNSQTRTEPNWIAFAIALAFVPCFLFLPFVKIIAVLPINGMFIMSKLNAVMCLPLIAGILMMLSAIFFDYKVSAGIGGATAVLVLVLMLCSNSILVGADISHLIGGMAQQYIGTDISGFLAPRAGLGCIFCIALAIIFMVVELLMGNGYRRTSQPLNENPWTDL